MAKSKTPAKRARAALAARLKQPQPLAGAAHTAQQVLRAAETLADGVLRVAPATPATPAVPLSTVTTGARALAERLAPTPTPMPTPPVDFANQPVPTAEWVHVTPQVAAAWLERNTHNRPLRQRLVDRYARDMAAGRWHRNGETVKLARDGTVLDGQHRLWSIVQSETAVWLLVVRDLEPEVQATVDTGSARKFRDVLSLARHANAANLAALARWLWLHDTDQLYDNGYSSTAPSHGELEAALERHPVAAEAVSAVAGEFKPATRFLAQSVLSFLTCLGFERDPVATRAFLQALAFGEGLTRESPVYRLRDRCLTARTARTRLEPDTQMALATKAFNYWRAGRSIQALTWRRNEAFPRMDD